MSDELRYKIGWDGREVDAGAQRTANVFELFKKKLIETREAITSFNAWLDVTKKGFAAMQKGVEFLREGAIFAEAQANFRATAASYGQFSDTIIEASKKASDNQVSTLNLIKSNTRAMQLGVASDAGTLAKLWEIANAKSDQFGESMVTTFDKIVTAVGKGQGRLLLELGLLPESFARSANAADLLKNRGELLKTVLSQGAEEVARLSGVTNTANDAIGRYDAAMEDLKGSFGEIATAMTPAINAFATLVGLMAKGVTFSGKLLNAWAHNDWKDLMKNQYADLVKDITAKGGSFDDAIAELLKKRDERLAKIQSIQSEIAKGVQGQSSADPSQSFRSSSGGTAFPRPTVDLAPGNVEFERGQILLINQALGLAREMQAQKKNADEVRVRIEGLNNAVAGTAKAGKVARETMSDLERILVSLNKSIQGTFLGKQDDTLRKVEENFVNISMAAAGIPRYLADARDHMRDLALGGDKFRQIVDEQNKIAMRFGPNAVKTAIGGGNQKRWVSLEEQEYVEKAAKAKEDLRRAEEEFAQKLKIDVAGAFESGLYDALNGGNFLDSFGKALRSQVARAFAASVTANLFQGGGSFQMGAAGGSGFSILNPATYIPAIASALSPQQSKQSQGSSVDGLGGLLDFGPMMKGGQVQWGNLTQYAAAGAALQFLTSPGRLFGGTVVHGQEAVQQASDINSRVSQARTDRQALIGTVGLSEDTVKKLSDLVFWTAGYNKNESGDGWFKGPKTTTYELNATQANAALEEFTKLTKQAQIDLAKRAYEIGTTQLDRPFTALQMSLDDLREALNRTVDEESRYALQLQIKQTESQRQNFWTGNFNDWMSFLISTPMAGFGSDRRLEYQYTPLPGGNADPNSQPGVRANILWGDPQQNQTWDIARLFDPESTAMQRFRRGFFTPEGTYKIGDTTMNPEEFESWAGTQVMMQGLRNQGSSAWDIQEQIARGAKPWDVEVDGQKYTDILTERMGGYQTMLDELDEKISDETLTMAQRSQLFSQFTAALTAYYGAKQEALDLELQQQEEAKRKQQKLRDDKMSSLLSFVGEVGGRTGNTYNILSPSQTVSLLEEVRAAAMGTNPELVTLLDGLIAQGKAKAKWGNA